MEHGQVAGSGQVHAGLTPAPNEPIWSGGEDGAT